MSDFTPFLSIAASAGSGKTFQLAHRVLRLLAMDQDPDRIGAYTFSRKAAGEIFDAIVSTLLTSSASESNAAATSRHIDLSRSHEDFEADLRNWFDHMHRLRIGTLDSRISRMLSAASFELGLPPDFALLDSDSADYLRIQSQLLHRLFSGSTLQADEAETFLHLFEQATHGRAEKDFLRQMEAFLADYRHTFLEYPDAEMWQGPALADPPQLIPDDERKKLAQQLIHNLPGEIDTTSVATALEKMILAASDFTPGSLWSNQAPKGTLWKNFLADPQPTIIYRNKDYPLSDAYWHDLKRLLRHPLAAAIEEVQRKTKAVYGFLLRYELAYRQSLRNTGQLSFEDASMLMAGFHQLTPEELAYRLDGEIDHWLLDEFQDTSPLQWAVLEPFISEILQDPESTRSFFYVGDVKQAIYAWRGGDSKLFQNILDDWPVITSVPMNNSWRSAPAVLDLVNLICDDLPDTDALPRKAVERWNDVFSSHTSARPDLPGHARVLQAHANGPDLESLVVHLARDLPADRETAILVRTNDEGRRYAHLLREAGCRVSQEGASILRDCTAIEVLLAALRLAAHPGDTLSEGLLKLAGLSINPEDVLHQCHEQGITPTLRTLAERLPLKEGADYARLRIERLIQLARSFDAQGDASIDRFLDQVDRTRIKEQEARGVIRIMTIHQSKGLGFDAVIFPIKSSATLVKPSTEAPALHTPDVGPARLGLLPPADVCKAVPEYRDMLQDLSEQSAYENICNLYVALTRAKQSLQVVLPADASPDKSLKKTGNWLCSRIPTIDSLPENVLWQAGSSDWVRDSEPESLTAPPRDALSLQPGRAPLPRLEPSQADTRPRPADTLFVEIAEDGRDLGTRVHELLRQMTWTDGQDVDAFLETHHEEPDSEVADHIRTIWTSPVLRKHDHATELWREQKFESLLPDGWITGVFDRVILLPDAAIIQDYKTNRKTDDETIEHYRPQMALYRRVLADMLSLDPALIQCQLLFTRTGECVDV